MNQANNLKYSDIKIGGVYQFKRKILKKDVMDFAKLTGDFNPLHVDEEFGKKSRFNANVVHGMLAGSLFSTLVGMYCPGKNCLYMKQTLNFKSEIYPGDVLTVRGTVLNKNDSIRMIVLKTELLKEEKLVIDGEANVIMLN